ncbi:MAG: hypothetical protein IJ064_05765 [Bacteroidaceae bacterium]|nr:hypothetical protein [Bacteroidaceae bacterium]
MSNDFTYCKGSRCVLKEHCTRYLDGLKLPDGNWWWMQDCGENRTGYINRD